MDPFITQCKIIYNINVTGNKIKKYRCYITNDEIPSRGITISELYQAKDNPSIKIIYTVNGVRKNTKRLGQAQWIPIEKRSFWRNMFIRLETPDQIEIARMKRKRESLKIEK